MDLVRTAVSSVLLAIAFDSNAGQATKRYFELTNAAHDSVTALAVAASGSDTFQPVPFKAPLRGGLTSTTIEIPGDGCRQDFRVVFRDGRTLFYRDIDVCRHRGLRLRASDGKR